MPAAGHASAATNETAGKTPATKTDCPARGCAHYQIIFINIAHSLKNRLYCTHGNAITQGRNTGESTMATIINLNFDGAILTERGGQPVLVYEGREYGPADTVPTDTIFGDEPAYRMGQSAVGRGSKTFSPEQLVLQAKWDEAGERLGLSKW